jgi:hypothetical protein
MDALASYVQFLEEDGTPTGNNFQNFFAEQTRSYNGATFLWAGFGYSGAAVDINAANTQASLVFYLSPVILGFADTAARENWLVRVFTVWLDPVSLNETSDRLAEIFTLTSWQHDLVQLRMQLGSPLDAQAAEIPARVLSEGIVGRLPPTGSVSFV